MTKLEAFGDHFERLATTAEQRELALEFKAFVGEFIRAVIPRGDEIRSFLALDGEEESLRQLHGHDTLSGLFKEIRADEAAGKREDAHGYGYGKEAFLKVIEGKTEVPAAEKVNDRGIER